MPTEYTGYDQEGSRNEKAGFNAGIAVQREDLHKVYPFIVDDLENAVEDLSEYPATADPNSKYDKAIENANQVTGYALEEVFHRNWEKAIRLGGYYHYSLLLRLFYC